jgi:hypothetical protein
MLAPTVFRTIRVSAPPAVLYDRSPAFHSQFLIPDGLRDIESAQVSATAHRIPLMLTLLFFISLTSYSSLVTAYRPLVSLHYGTFEGATDGNLTKFLGVPFARPA